MDHGSGSGGGGVMRTTLDCDDLANVRIAKGFAGAGILCLSSDRNVRQKMAAETLYKSHYVTVALSAVLVFSSLPFSQFCFSSQFVNGFFYFTLF